MWMLPVLQTSWENQKEHKALDKAIQLSFSCVRQFASETSPINFLYCRNFFPSISLTSAFIYQTQTFISLFQIRYLLMPNSFPSSHEKIPNFTPSDNFTVFQMFPSSCLTRHNPAVWDISLLEDDHLFLFLVLTPVAPFFLFSRPAHSPILPFLTFSCHESFLLKTLLTIHVQRPS